MESFSQEFAKLGHAEATRHVFLCIGPDCCDEQAGLQSWETLKRLLKTHDIAALRTKAACFRICSGGPWMLIYPEGIWYNQVTPERCARIVEEHLLQNRPIREWLVRERPLCGGHCAGK